MTMDFGQALNVKQQIVNELQVAQATFGGATKVLQDVLVKLEALRGAGFANDNVNQVTSLLADLETEAGRLIERVAGAKSLAEDM